jgi:hypothetical protein
MNEIQPVRGKPSCQDVIYAFNTCLDERFLLE